MQKRDKQSGRYVRTVEVWDGSLWNEGYVDNKGRFRVYRPDCPRAYSGGYALRAHVVWWLRTGSAHPRGTNLHHKDGNKQNDVFENLECKDARKHTIDHLQQLRGFTCANCGGKFFVTGKELARRAGEGRLPKFCSQACYHEAPRSALHKTAISRGLKRAYREGRRL